MEIKTKFSIGDEVFFIFKNRVLKSIVSFIKIYVDMDSNITIEYIIIEPYFRSSGDPAYINGVKNKAFKVFKESELYTSKQELIKSL
jgi:hypothetical protein